MKQRYPGDWAIEAFTFWVDYFWQHGKEPTYEQWKKYKVQQRSFNEYKDKCLRIAKKTGLETLKLLYEKLGVKQ